VRDLWTESQRYEPKMGDDERQTLLADWRRALQRAGRWVIPD
jgi:glycerol kinase